MRGQKSIVKLHEGVLSVQCTKSQLLQSGYLSYLCTNLCGGWINTQELKVACNYFLKYIDAHVFFRFAFWRLNRASNYMNSLHLFI